MKQQNKAGTWFSMIQVVSGGWVVYRLCENYGGSIRGGISSQWRHVEPEARMGFIESQRYAREGIGKIEAQKLFNRKIKGKQK